MAKRIKQCRIYFCINFFFLFLFCFLASFLLWQNIFSLHLIFLIKIFLIKILFKRAFFIIRRNFYVVSNIFRHRFFFGNLFTFFQKHFSFHLSKNRINQYYNKHIIWEPFLGISAVWKIVSIFHYIQVNYKILFDAIADTLPGFIILL